MDEALRVPVERLHALCDAAGLGFETTAELEPRPGWVGQQDAIEALRFGVAMDAEGYHAFVVGRSGSGRHSSVLETLRSIAAERPTPDDRCYVADFEEPRRPRLVTLPAGRGPAFRAAVADLVDDLRIAIPTVLASPDVNARRVAILQEEGARAAAALARLRDELADDPFVVLVGEETVTAAPARGGERLTPEAYRQLAEPLRAEIDAHVRDAEARLVLLNQQVRELEATAQRRVAQLHDGVVRRVVERRVETAKAAFQSVPDAIAHLDALAADAARSGVRFAQRAEPDPRELPFAPPPDDFFRRYRVNVFVTHAPDSGAPVVQEANPTHGNLIGRLERQLRYGAMVTDFTGIAAGAVQRAAGGFLVLDALDLLSKPLAWQALERVLRTGRVVPTEPGAELGLIATETLEPESMPAPIKVVLVGEPLLYYLLLGADPRFGDLFKVKVDYRPWMERTAETEQEYAVFLAGLCRRESLPPFHASAVASVIEHGARLVADQRRLTTRFADIADLAREAAHARGADGPVVAADVERVLAARRRRNDRPFREVLELISRGVLAFEPTGTRAGQVHGIGLLGLGDLVFGRPIRVMASAWLGTGGLVDIEREAELSGPIHSKGFLVVAGYLGRRFARRHPLIVSATVSFDQLYEEVEGDSASAAELYALLSAIGRVHLRQGVAVTGAVNQDGLVLPVGGVTEKVEGYFAACRLAGLTGEQGVMLPRRNLDNLTLAADVRAAVAAGEFHLHAIDRIEDGWSVLTGRPAGRPLEDGSFPPDSIHAAVAAQLAEWHEAWVAAGQPSAARDGAAPRG